MELKIDQQELKDFILENFDMEDFVNILCDDKVWLNDVLAEKAVQKIHIDKKELLQSCASEFFRDCEIRWHELEEKVYDEVSRQLAENLISQVSFTLNFKGDKNNDK